MRLIPVQSETFIQNSNPNESESFSPGIHSDYSELETFIGFILINSDWVVIKSDWIG